MKRIIVILLCSFFTTSIFSQKLNKLGKIVIDEISQKPDYRVEKLNGLYKVITDSFSLDGNTLYKIPNGYITSLELANNEKDYIKHYDANRKLIATIFSDRIINLKVSSNGSSLVFYDSQNIIRVNLSNYHVDTVAGSFVYSFIGNEFMYYNPDDKSIYYKGTQIEIAEYPNQFMEHNGMLLVISKQYIYELTGNSLHVKHKFKGKLFDAKIINGEFYFVDKIEKRKTEAYTLYKTSTFTDFIIVDKLDDLNR